MPDVSVKWDTATVKNAKLAVDLDGKLSAEWKDSFGTTVRLLGHGDWGEVELRKQAIRVNDVTPGSEEKLRHHLEAVIAQANAAAESAQAKAEDAETNKKDRADGPDAEMTRSFRAFGDAGSE